MIETIAIIKHETERTDDGVTPVLKSDQEEAEGRTDTQTFKVDFSDEGAAQGDKAGSSEPIIALSLHDRHGYRHLETVTLRALFDDYDGDGWVTEDDVIDELRVRAQDYIPHHETVTDTTITHRTNSIKFSSIHESYSLKTGVSTRDHVPNGEQKNRSAQ